MLKYYFVLLLTNFRSSVCYEGVYVNHTSCVSVVTRNAVWTICHDIDNNWTKFIDDIEAIVHAELVFDQQIVGAYKH